MSRDEPKLTLGVPVYNGEQFLSEALDSLLAQSYTNWVMKISDNASTDRTEEICRDYTARDRRIRYERLERNVGAVPNFNRVFERCETEYFKWAADDDVCAPDFLERAVETLDRDDSIAWCHSRSTHIDSEGRLFTGVDTADVSYADRQAPTPHERFHATLLGTGGCLDSFGLFRSRVVNRTPLYLPHYGAEKVFIAEMGLRGRYREISEVLFFPRIHNAGAGGLNTAAEQQEFIDPAASARFRLTRLRLLRGYASAILRAELDLGERARCFAVLARYLLQLKKWKPILMRTLRGAGMRAGNVDRLRQLKESSGSDES